jgi:hypothetical protein
VLKPNERAFLYDLDWPRKSGLKAKVLAAAARVKQEAFNDRTFAFTTRGPKATRANARILLPTRPQRVTSDPPISITQQWDEATATLLLSFDNLASDIAITVEM